MYSEISSDVSGSTVTQGELPEGSPGHVAATAREHSAPPSGVHKRRTVRDGHRVHGEGRFEHVPAAFRGGHSR